MADSGGRNIPNGWTFVDKVKSKSDRPHYLCPATGQHFNTYEDMMRYVTYAKIEQLSIYAPDFDSEGKGKTQKKEAGKRSSKSAKKQKGPRGPNKRARLLYAKPTYSADQEDEDGEKSSDSSSDPNDPSYSPRAERGRSSRIRSKPNSDVGSENPPDSPGVGPGSNCERFSKLSLDSGSEPDHLPYSPGVGLGRDSKMLPDPSSDSGSDSDDPPYSPGVGRGSKSKMFPKLSSDSGPDPNSPLEIEPGCNAKMFSKVLSLDSTSESDDEPYLPGTEPGSTREVLPETGPPKIIIYQRRSKLKSLADRNPGKTGKP